MSKREDAYYIKVMSRVLPIVKEWAKVPLLVLDKNTHVAEEAAKEKERVLKRSGTETQGVTDAIFNDLMKDLVTYAPSQDFLLLDKTIDIDVEDDNKLTHNYYYISVSAGDHPAINILYPTRSEGLMWFVIVKDSTGTYQARILQAKGEIDEQWSAEDVEAGKFNYKGVAPMDQVTLFMSTLTIWTACVIRTLGYSDKYAVEVRGKQHRKVHDKKPWTRSDLATIIYLNKLPTEHKEPLGGHHSSPQPHPRRGHERHLKNECYKNHPRFGDSIWIKSSWIGPKKTVVNNVTFKVL